MDAKAKVVLESAVHRTLHAHAFSRSSSQASLVLTDLLSRYLTLLASTCAKYAEHAGRTDLTPQDALRALNELGVSMEEVDEYRSTEAVELGRYATNTARRIEELKDFKFHLAEGLRGEHDVIPLVYAPVPDDLLENSSDDGGDEEEHVDDVSEEIEHRPITNGVHSPMKDPPPRISTPPLPLSPISNVSSPPRKRKRANSSYAASHIPYFLPPYPSEIIAATRPPSPRSPPPEPSQLPPIKIERPASPLPQLSTPTYASDYLTCVPYSHSSLSSMPESHLPSSRAPRQSQANPPRQPTLQTQPTLFAAYHHILTRPVPPSSNANLSRHKVAMALLALTQNNPRWDPPSTLYSSSAPCPPRVSVIGPTFPTLVSDVPSGLSALGDLKAVDADRERKANLLPLPPRAVFSNERITSLISQQSSRIPELARHVLPGSVHSRTTRLAHPPPLFRGSQRLLYGPGVNAPWNANTGPTTVAATPTTAKIKDSANPNGTAPNAVEKRIPDARLHTTWDVETKRYNEPLPVGRKGRMSSMSGLTLSLGSRAPSESKPV